MGFLFSPAHQMAAADMPSKGSQPAATKKLSEAFKKTSTPTGRLNRQKERYKMFLFVMALLVLCTGVVLCLTLKNRMKFAILALSILLGGALILGSCVVSVPTGHTGVVTTFGRVENYTLASGIHLKAPWQNVVKMDNRVQKHTADLSCFSSDIQEVTMIYTINYQIKKSDAMTIYSTIGTDYYNTVILPCVMESVKVVTAHYTAESLVGSRDALAATIEEDLTTKLLRYNIEVVSTSIENMDFTDAFTDAVEAKQVAQQNRLRAETEAEQQIVEANAAAEVRRVQADAEAYEMLKKAEAEAEANLVLAEAEAEANQKLAQSLTDALISYNYVNRWNGELPTVMSGESELLPVLDVNEFVNQE